MTGDDVDGDEMDDLNDFDDVTTEALMEGFGGDGEPAVGAFLDAVRSTYRSQPLMMDAALASFLTDELRPPSPAKKRIPNMRSLLTAKVALTVAAVVAGTGGLAVAGAITGVRPSVLQSHSHSKDHVGVNLPVHASQHAVDATSSNPSSAHDGEPPETTVDPPTTVSPEPTDPPTTVSPEPTDPPQPCEADHPSTDPSAVCPPGGGHDGSGDQGHDGSGDQGKQGQSGSGDQGNQGQSGSGGQGQSGSGDHGGSSGSSGDQGGQSGNQGGDSGSGGSTGGVSGN